MTEPDFSSKKLCTGVKKDDPLFQTVSGLSTNNFDVSEEITLQQNGNESNKISLEKNPPSGTINNNQTNGSNGTNHFSSATVVATPDNRQEGSGDS